MAYRDERGEWDHGWSTQWRARIAAALGETDEALELLDQAHQEGWAYQGYLLRDQDFLNLPDRSRFVAFVQPIG